MVHCPRPEELEQFAAAEDAEAEAHQLKAQMLSDAKARNISGWQDAVSPEEESDSSTVIA